VDGDYTGAKVECYHCGDKFVVEQVYVDSPSETERAAPSSPSSEAESDTVLDADRSGAESAVYVEPSRSRPEEVETPIPTPRPSPKSSSKRPVSHTRATEKRKRRTTAGQPGTGKSKRDPRPAAPPEKKRSAATLVFVALSLLTALGVGGYFILTGSSSKKISAGVLDTSHSETRTTVGSMASSKPSSRTPTSDVTTKHAPAPPIKHAAWPVSRVRVDAAKIVSERDVHRLLGTNVALWYARIFKDRGPDKVVDGWMPGFIRMPGGSWSDSLYWNGNGVDRENGFDKHTGIWKVDYSRYSPGFMVEGKGNRKSRQIRKGTQDVRILHDFIKRHKKYAEALVTVNFGTGDARMAAEWVRWANKKMGYGVKYWQVGNEMDGGWESGHYIWPDGREVTAEIYAEKFERYVDAMKKIDPSIKVGAQIPGEWVDALLKRCAGKVDYVDHHFYYRDRERINDGLLGAFADLNRTEKDVKRDRAMIAKYSPNKKIEVGVTEWNVHGKGPETVDIECALLSCYAVGRMMRMGVDFATQWDLSTCNSNTLEGHGLASIRGKGAPPRLKAQYWALWLWSWRMFDKMVEAKVDGAEKLFAFATIDPGKTLSLMIINVETNKSAVVNVDVSGFKCGSIVKETLLSDANCFWEPSAKRQLWSREPITSYASGGDKPSILVPPYSVKVVEIPVAGTDLESKFAASAAACKRNKIASLEIVIPENSPPVDKLRGFVIAKGASGDAVPGPSPPATIDIVGPASVDSRKISLDAGVGRFVLKSISDSGNVTIKVVSGGLSTKKIIHVRSPKFVDVPLLQFENGRDLKCISLKLGKLRLDPSRRPNQNVLADNLTGCDFKVKHNTLFFIRLDKLHKAPLGNIGGVFFDVALSRDFSSDSVKLGVSLGKQRWFFTLRKDPNGKFERKRFLVATPEEHSKTRNAQSCWIMIEGKKPLRGSVFIDAFGVVEYK